MQIDAARKVRHPGVPIGKIALSGHRLDSEWHRRHLEEIPCFHIVLKPHGHESLNFRLQIIIRKQHNVITTLKIVCHAGVVASGAVP